MRWRQFYQKFKILENSNLFFNVGQIEKPRYPNFIHNYEILFDSKREFRGTWSENGFFSKFHKI